MSRIVRILLAVLILCSVGLGNEPVTSLRQIDFRNFDFAWSDPPESVPLAWHWLTEPPKLHLKTANGMHRFYNPKVDDYPPEHAPRVTVIAINFGDLDGDGEEEAAVALNYSTGGTANWDYLYVYKLKNGQPTLLARMETGSRGSGGLIRAMIKESLLIVDFADADRQVGDCCSEGYIRVRYKLQRGHFVEEGARERGDLELREGLPPP